MRNNKFVKIVIWIVVLLVIAGLALPAFTSFFGFSYYVESLAIPPLCNRRFVLRLSFVRVAAASDRQRA